MPSKDPAQFLPTSVQKSYFMLSRYPDRRLTGKVEGISPAVQSQDDSGAVQGVPFVQRDLDWVRIAQRFPVRILIENPDPAVFRMGTTAIDLARSQPNRLRQSLMTIRAPQARVQSVRNAAESRSTRRGKGGTTLCPTIKSNFLTVKGKKNCSYASESRYTSRSPFRRLRATRQPRSAKAR